MSPLIETDQLVHNAAEIHRSQGTSNYLIILMECKEDKKRFLEGSFEERNAPIFNLGGSKLNTTALIAGDG